MFKWSLTGLMFSFSCDQSQLKSSALWPFCISHWFRKISFIEWNSTKSSHATRLRDDENLPNKRLGLILFSHKSESEVASASQLFGTRNRKNWQIIRSKPFCTFWDCMWMTCRVGHSTTLSRTTKRLSGISIVSKFFTNNRISVILLPSCFFNPS